MMKKGVVGVAVSGGMDSLRASVLLQEKGYDVIGLFMTLTSEHNTEKLKILAGKFHIPIVEVNTKEVFERDVILPFIESYLKGLTPNPCVICNASIKFGFLLSFWKSNKEKICRLYGISSKPLPLLATGHYATIVPPEKNPYQPRYGIMRHGDESKDQSYFLYRLSQNQLSCALFPLESESKKEVAKWIASTGIEHLISPESQEICFIPSGNYVSFLERRIPELSCLSGPIKDTSGRILGYHKGLHRYTIGQRRGIGIPSSAPYYVLRISPEENTLYVGRKHELYSKICYVSNLNWVSIERPLKAFRSLVKIRNQHEPASATVEPLSEDQVLVEFDVPQNAVTPGQSAVFYDGPWLLGGGIISGTNKLKL